MLDVDLGAQFLVVEIMNASLTDKNHAQWYRNMSCKIVGELKQISRKIGWF